jgi:uncharacterized protein (TIGR00251 family)
VEHGTKLTLRVSPGAARDGVVGRHGDGWKVRVAAPPEGGKANDAVVRLLADAAGVPRRDVEIVAGHGSREKIVSLHGVDSQELDERLASAAAAMGKDRV